MEIKIRVNENIKLTMDMQEELSLVEFNTILESTSRIIKSFNKEMVVFGNSGGATGRHWVRTENNNLTKANKKELTKIWETNEIADRRPIILKRFPELSNRTDKQLYQMIKNFKKYGDG